MKKLLALVFLVALFGCGEDTIIEVPTAPEPLEPVRLDGAWTATVSASSFPASVWTMELNQDGFGVSGTWLDDVNGLDGTVTGTVSVDGTSFEGTMTLRVAETGELPTCTATATVRSSDFILGADGRVLQMSWTTPGWGGPLGCEGAPLQTTIRWSRQ